MPSSLVRSLTVVAVVGLGVLAGVAFQVGTDDSEDWTTWIAIAAPAAGIVVASLTAWLTERALRQASQDRERAVRVLYELQSRALDNLTVIEDSINRQEHDLKVGGPPPEDVRRALVEVKRSSSALASEGAVDDAREIDRSLRSLLASTQHSSWLLVLPKDVNSALQAQTLEADTGAGGSS